MFFVNRGLFVLHITFMCVSFVFLYFRLFCAIEDSFAYLVFLIFFSFIFLPVVLSPVGYG